MSENTDNRKALIIVGVNPHRDFVDDLRCEVGKALNLALEDILVVRNSREYRHTLETENGIVAMFGDLSIRLEDPAYKLTSTPTAFRQMEVDARNRGVPLFLIGGAPSYQVAQLAAQRLLAVAS